MTRVNVAVHYETGGTRTVVGYLIAPGLAVHRAVKEDGTDVKESWVVTHLPSGDRVGGSLPLKKDAVRAAEGYAKLADWTKAAEGLGQPLASDLDPELHVKIRKIRDRILAESAGLPIALPVPQPVSTHAERTAFGGEPVRADHMLFAHEVSKLNQQFVERAESSLVRTQVETLRDRIRKGEAWLMEHEPIGTAPAKRDAAKKLLSDLRARLARVRFENELPAEVLGFVNALVHTTTAYKLRIPGAYVRIVIPDVLTFEADLIFEDVPF